MLADLKSRFSVIEDELKNTRVTESRHFSLAVAVEKTVSCVIVLVFQMFVNSSLNERQNMFTEEATGGVP